MRLLGYQFNKDYTILFNKQDCIESDSRIDGCIFWMRNDYLEKTQAWSSLYIKDDAYCSEQYTLGNRLQNSLDEMNDPKCSYLGFLDKKRKENWDYLTSDEKDGYYNYCLKQYCSRPPLFK